MAAFLTLPLLLSAVADAADPCNAAELPKAVAREAAHVFPGVDLTDMLAVPTCQHSDVDLVRTGEKIEQEKDRLLERVRSPRSDDGGQSVISILLCMLLLLLH